MLAEDPEYRIEREKQAGQQTVRGFRETHPHHKQDGEKQGPLQQSLVNLRGMTRLEKFRERFPDFRIFAGGYNQLVESLRIRQLRIDLGAGLPRGVLYVLRFLTDGERKFHRPLHAIGNAAIKLAIHEIRRTPE